MNLERLLAAADVVCPEKYKNIEVNEIVTDSRKISAGCMFVCIKGRNFDGHDCIDFAIKAGASVIVVEGERGECVGGAAIISVDNTRHVIPRLYNYRFGEPTKKLKLIGVTGTNGKTSVCTMLYSIFKRAGFKVGFIGTTGCFIGDLSRNFKKSDLTTPDAEELYRLFALMAERGVEFVFMEVSSHALALGRVRGLNFDTAIFTNLTRDHLDFHSNIEEYFSAKQSLFRQCRQGVVNTDSVFGQRVAEEAFCPIFTCSMMGKGDFSAQNLKARGSDGTEYELVHSGGRPSRVFVPIAGEFSVMNSLEALAVSSLYGIDISVAATALEKMSGVSGRMEKLPTNSDLDVFIDYAHTPDALESVLKTARSIRKAGQKITVVFGCGGNRDRGKRKEMGMIASSLADLTVVTSDNSRDEDTGAIISDILRGVDKEKPYAVIPDREEAIKAAVEFARHGEMIILAGKGHERYEINSRGKFPFDEKKIALEAMSRRYDKLKKG